MVLGSSAWQLQTCSNSCTTWYVSAYAGIRSRDAFPTSVKCELDALCEGLKAVASFIYHGKVVFDVHHRVIRPPAQS